MKPKGKERCGTSNYKEEGNPEEQAARMSTTTRGANTTYEYL